MDCQPSVDEVLHLAPQAAIDQLSDFRHVFDATLVPQLASRPGYWCLGSEFTDSTLLKAGGYLLDLDDLYSSPMYQQSRRARGATITSG
jgi:hypothetical protein